MLNIIDHKIGWYDHVTMECEESRMKFSSEGKKIFSEFKSCTVFEELIDHDLIVKTDRLKIEITKGNNKGKTKYVTKKNRLQIFS